MANISAYLAAIMAAVYGQDVRSSIHDAIEIINEVSEVILTTGTAVTGPTSSSTGFFTDSIYLNTNTMELWKCIGTNSWASMGTLKGADGRGISSITLTSSSGLVDTYTITYDDGSTPDTFTVTNGAPGTNGTDGSKWYKGTAITGTGTGITGFPGNINDFYLNSTDGYVYNCTASGDATTATWDYVMTLTGGGGSSITVVDNLNSTSGTDALSANQGRVLKGMVDGKASDNQTFTQASTRANLVSGESFSTIFGKLMKWYTDLKSVAFSGSYNDLSNQPTIPAAANNGQLTIQQNGTTKGTFTADQSGNTTINLQTTEEVATASVSSGSVTFTGVDDTTNGGYDVYFDITSSSTNKNPYAKLTTVSGEGTASMTLVYDTDADNGTNTAHLYKVK